MSCILNLARKKVRLQRSQLHPKGHALAYSEIMRQACVAAVREARKGPQCGGRTGTGGNKLPRRKKGMPFCPRTQAEFMTECTHLHLEIRLVGERIALAQQGRVDEIIRMDELEVAELLEGQQDRNSRRSRRGGREREKKGRTSCGLDTKGGTDESNDPHVTRHRGTETRRDAEGGKILNTNHPLPPVDWREKGRKEATDLD